MNNGFLYWTLISLVSLAFFWDEFLSLLNASIHRTDIDPRVSDFYDAVQYQRTLEYHRDRERLRRIESIFMFILTITALALGLFGRLDTFLATLISQDTGRALVFFGILFIVSDLLNLPFTLYGTFILEEKYGFNKTTLATFITDKLKSYLLTAIVGGGILLLLLLLIEALGSLFWLAFTAAAVVILLLINMFYSTLILPLFNKLSPLEEGELKEAVENYARKQNIQLEGIYVMDGSRRSTKANAFFSGLGPVKKIILFDTLIEKHPVDELVAILAHETGHLKLGHILKGFFFSSLQILLTMGVFSLMVASPVVSQALGAQNYSIQLNLLAFGILYTPLASLIGLAVLYFSRKHEYQADAFAARSASMDAMATALKRLHSDNLAELYPHPLYVFCTYSHPSLLQRLDELGA